MGHKLSAISGIEPGLCTSLPLQLSIALGCFHLACGAVAAAVSSRRQERTWPQRTAKVLAVGFLALVEVLLVREEGAEGA